MATNEVASRGIEWLSRTITILIVMVGPGMLGHWLDRKFGLKYLSLVGLFLGLGLGTYILLLLAQKLSPPARGTPIPFEDSEGNDPWDAEVREDSNELPSRNAPSRDDPSPDA